ncbi:MAG TPA: ABC transporter permease subunit [Anaerolineae bacterium]|nr:ABC transporter permease subunit [Anaerolineae bacterium]
MNWRAIWAIVRKDLKVVIQNKGVSIPLIIVPLVFMVIMPALAGLVPIFEEDLASSMRDLQAFLENMPPAMRETLAGYDEAQTIVVLMVAYFLAPMYLILPLIVASVIAADSFAGEKERKTMEALLYTPTTDGELLLAKLLSAWLPAIAVSWGGFLIYTVVANVAAWPVMGRVWFPNWTWVTLALWVAPAIAGLGLGVTVIVSSRVNTFQEAYQLGAIVVLPILLLVVGQATGVIYFQGALVLLLGLLFWLVDAALLWFGARSFRRSELAAGM